MDLLGNSFITDSLNAVSQGLLVPTVVCLLLLLAYTAYTLGSVVVEIVTERKAYKVRFPQLVEDMDAASYGQLDQIIDRSGLLDSQRKGLKELVVHMGLPEDALTEVAKRILANEKERYGKSLALTKDAVKIAPMLGLMGTLIPLGPGIAALASGELEVLSNSLLVAFDTTVVGLAVAVICYLVTRIRARWYEDYLLNMEGALNTLLEKAESLHEADCNVMVGGVEL